MQLACIPSNSKLQTGFGCVWAGCRNTLWWFRLRLKNMFFLLQAVRNEWVVQCSSMDLRLLVFLTGLSIVCNMWMKSHHYTWKLHCLDQWEVSSLHYWQMVSAHFKGGGSCAMPPAFIWEFSVCCCRANYFTVVVFYRMAIEWQAAFLLDAKLILISLFLFSDFSLLKQTQTWPMSEVLVWSSEQTWTHSNCREINWNHAAAV